MKKKKYRRRLVADCRILIIMSFVTLVIYLVEVAKQLGYISLDVFWGIVKVLPQTSVVGFFLIIFIILSVINIFYYILFGVAILKGEKYVSHIDGFQRVDRFNKRLGKSYKFIIHLPDGEEKKSFKYALDLHSFYKAYPRHMCSHYCYRNMIFITDIW